MLKMKDVCNRCQAELPRDSDAAMLCSLDIDRDGPCPGAATLLVRSKPTKLTPVSTDIDIDRDGPCPGLAALIARVPREKTDPGLKS